MKTYLLETFRYNDWANRKLLQKISELPDKSESIRLFSHLINSQNKWMARIKGNPLALNMDWFLPEYPLEQLESEWANSLPPWLEYIEARTDEELNTEVQFIGFDGGLYAARPKDIAIQLNFHSIHHRAQMQTIIRQQGLQPDFLDYIGTKYRKIL